MIRYLNYKKKILSYFFYHIWKMLSLEKIGEIYEELSQELLEEQKELEKINKKIKKHGIIEWINIKEMESEILYETKALEKIERKLL